ncbi:MAG TPA: ATP-binding cassette domain-containing protein, partial [Ideonella sp.]|nr:ATP-binding cassette domain-containing protein [Ideonella sp.]
MNAVLAPAGQPAGRLEVNGLQKSYGPRMVVNGVHLAVGAGEVVGLLGPNGAGKTTSFYMIVGLVRADAGEITIEGRRVERLPIHERSRMGLSYLPQEASIFRKLTVEENIRAVLELQRGPDGRPLPARRIE